MAEKHRWCCNLITLRTGTIIIAVVYMILNIVEVTGAAIRLNPHRKFDEIIIWGDPVTRSQVTIFLVLSCIQAVSNVLLGVGAKLENPWMALPWLIMETIVGTVASVICISVIGRPNIGLSVGFVLFVAINGYFFVIVYKFYQALRKKRKILRNRELESEPV